MEKLPLFISFCAQKGGIGKTTFTIFAADWFYYKGGLNVLVVDCDYPQHSIDELRNREKKVLSESNRYKLLMMRQFEKYPKKAFPILRCRPDNAINQTKEFIENSGQHFDFVLFDLPGTVNSVGVIHIISQLDYIFVPMRPDRLVMQSTLNFARTISERFVCNPAANTKDLYLFWNMVDRRERPDLCAPYESLMETINLKYFKTRIPVRSRFNKEFADTKGEISRSTIFMPDVRFLDECCFSALMQEITDIIKLE